MEKQTDLEADHTLHDVAIIGAGPCGLAVAARLREQTPSALFTEVEHQRYHWIRRHQQRLNIVKSNGRANHMHIEKANPSSRPAEQYSMLVLDSTSDKWLGRWKSLFSAYGIKHLRSPLFFHPDPRDRDGLKEFAFSQHREQELTELTGVVGKETSKHQKKKARCRKHASKGALREGVPVDGRDAQDYQTPTNDLFCDHCSNIVSNYTLSTSVSQSQVVSIEYATNGSSIFPDTAYFTLNTSKGPTFARIVVLAIGPGSSPLLPRPISLQESEGACHSSVLPQRGCPAPHVRERIVQKKITNVVVVGGGLTSAQISDLCIRKGVTRVWHLMRGAYKVKHFDVDLPWVSKYRNLEMAAFWSADSDEERFEKIRTARGGGSITPLFKKIEAKHVSNGRLRIHTNTEIVRQDWDSDKKTWHIETEPSIDDLPSIDHIYYATGAKADIQEVEMLENIRAQWPIRDVGGLPCLTHDLQWHEDLPLFVSGRFAGLRIGPGAPNLEGARIGAERIAWRIQELMERDLRQERAAGGDAGADILVKAQQGSCWRSTHAENLRASNMFSPLELVVS